MLSNNNGVVVLELSQNGLLEVLEKPDNIEVMIFQGKLISISPKIYDCGKPILEEITYESNFSDEDYTRY